MNASTEPTSTGDSTPAQEEYHVVLLVEGALTESDARQVVSLHQELEELSEPVTYHVLMPVDDAAARVEAAMGSLAAGEVMAAPVMVMSEVDIEEVRRECMENSEGDLGVTIRALRAAGGKAVGKCIQDPPIDALAAEVEAVDGREAIILTRPHVVAEFFHVDWTSKARRKIGVPVLHLLEQETFDEQSGGGEGITGL